MSAPAEDSMSMASSILSDTDVANCRYSVHTQDTEGHRHKRSLSYARAHSCCSSHPPLRRAGDVVVEFVRELGERRPDFFLRMLVVIRDLNYITSAHDDAPRGIKSSISLVSRRGYGRITPSLSPSAALHSAIIRRHWARSCGSSDMSCDLRRAKRPISCTFIRIRSISSSSAAATATVLAISTSAVRARRARRLALSRRQPLDDLQHLRRHRSLCEPLHREAEP